MSNKARNDKGSILVDVEALLDVFEPAFMLMPKVRRLHGAAVRMEDAADNPQGPFECDSNYSVSTANLLRKLNS